MGEGEIMWPLASSCRFPAVLYELADPAGNRGSSPAGLWDPLFTEGRYSGDIAGEVEGRD